MTHWYLFSRYNLVDDKNILLDKKIDTNYFENGEIKSSISYEYNDENLIKKESWANSNGDQYEKHYKYSGDFKGFNLVGLHEDGSILSDLNDQNRINLPVEIVTFNNGKVIEGKGFKYKFENNSIHLAEEKDFEIDFDKTSDYYHFSFLHPHLGLSFDSRYKTSKYYDLYDEFGNLIQEHKNNGVYNSYIYGYDGKYLIAEIENATYREFITALRATGDIKGDIDEEYLDRINSLRSSRPEWMITTYEHIPLVGIKNITQPNGVKTHYEYDDFNRLMSIKDKDDNLIESYEYHYKND